jgi:nitric oxide synthase oxygenase domain/subunit
VATTSEDELLYTFLIKVQKAIEVFIKKEIESVKYEALIELKYIKKSDYKKNNSKILSEKIAEAKKQLFAYSSAEEIKNKKKIKKWIIVFAGAEAVHLEEI